MNVAGIIDLSKLDKKLKVKDLGFALNILGLKYIGVNKKGANVIILFKKRKEKVFENL